MVQQWLPIQLLLLTPFMPIQLLSATHHRKQIHLKLFLFDDQVRTNKFEEKQAHEIERQTKKN